MFWSPLTWSYLPPPLPLVGNVLICLPACGLELEPLAMIGAGLSEVSTLLLLFA